MKKDSKKLNSIQIKGNSVKWIVQSRLIITALLLLLQILFIVLFILRLQKYIEFYFLLSIILSVVFMIYLTNRHGRNEFKIAWFIPLMIFPLVGVVFYYLYQTDTGEKLAKKALKKCKKQTDDILNLTGNEGYIKDNYPDSKDLQTYLISQKFPPFENNKIEYFPCGEEFYTDFIDSLKSAEKYIFIETFILKVEETWGKILEILEQKTKEGVEVRVMYDAFGSQLASEKFYLKYLRSKNIKTCVFNPMIPVFTTRQNSRDHRKIYIIDGKICYSGGLNLANEYFNFGKNRFPYWKDNAIKIEGEAIKSFLALFLQNWNMQRSAKEQEDYAKYLNASFEKYDCKGIAIPYGDDSYNNEDIAENVYMYIVNSSKKYLHITSPYILLDNNFQEALLFAAKRGIDVKIIVPSVPDHHITFCIGKTYLKTLIDNNVKVYLYDKGFIHAKTFISDDKIATVGSVNLDYRSFYHHFECGTVMYEAPVISKIEDDFQKTLLDCTQMLPGDFKKLPWIKRLIGRIFRIFAPLM